MSAGWVWRAVARSTLYGVLCLLPSLTQARSEAPIDPAFFALTDCPSHPVCPAIVLLEEIELNNEGTHTTYSYRRLLKVFTKDGITRHADVWLATRVGDYKIRNLRGRTILHDGTELELDGDRVVIEREISVRSQMVPPDNYKPVREFFAKVRDGDATALALEKTGQ